MKDLSFLFMMFYSLSVFSMEIFFSGVAKHPVTKEILYSEYHRIKAGDSGKYEMAWVSYRNEKGEEFAKKILDYRKRELVPSFQFKDHRTGTEIEVKNRGANLIVSYNSEENAFEKEINISSDLVVDSGFDQILTKSWKKIIIGEDIIFDFFVPSRGESIRFKLNRVYEDGNIIKLKLEPDSFFISILLDPIILTYDMVTKRILKYEGLTNIEEVIDGEITGSNIIACIDYNYEN